MEVHVWSEISVLYGCNRFGVQGQFYAVSYASVNADLVAHGRRFVEWLDRMYNPDTAQVWNGGRFEMFEPTRKPVFYFDTSTRGRWCTERA